MGASHRTGLKMELMKMAFEAAIRATDLGVLLIGCT
jgi:hypothetical protein